MKIKAVIQSVENTTVNHFKGKMSFESKAFDYEVTIPTAENEVVCSSFEELRNRYVIRIKNNGRHIILTKYEDYITFFSLLIPLCFSFQDKKSVSLPWERDIDISVEQAKVLSKS